MDVQVSAVLHAAPCENFPINTHLCQHVQLCACCLSCAVCVCEGVYLCICVCLYELSVYCLCVSVLSFSASPVGQLEGDSAIRAGPVVQRLSAVVSDTELSLSLNNCQSALVHSDPSGSLPLSHSNSPLDSHWQP